MSKNPANRPSDTNHNWEKTRSRSSAELLAVLAPTADEPQSIQRMAIWKTGPATAEGAA